MAIVAEKGQVCRSEYGVFYHPTDNFASFSRAHSTSCRNDHCRSQAIAAPQQDDIKLFVEVEKYRDFYKDNVKEDQCWDAVGLNVKKESSE